MQTSQGDDEIRRQLEFSNVINFEYMEQNWRQQWRTGQTWGNGPLDTRDSHWSAQNNELQCERKEKTRDYNKKIKEEIQ